MWRWLFLISLLLSLPLQAEPVAYDGIAAIVGTELITLSEVRESEIYFSEDPALATLTGTARQKEILNRLIDEKLIIRAANKEGVEVTTDDIERTIDNIIKQNNITLEVLESELKKQGMSMEEYRASMRKRMLEARYIDQVIRPRVNVSDAQIRAYYSREVASLTKQTDAADVWIIFVAVPDGADEATRALLREKTVLIRQLITDGKDFNLSAKESSDHPSAADGGFLGTFSKGQLFPLLDAAAFGLTPGQVSEPLESPQGYFLLKAQPKEGTNTVSYEQAKADIEQLLYQEEQERQLNLWLTEARASAHIEIFLDKPAERKAAPAATP